MYPTQLQALFSGRFVDIALDSILNIPGVAEFVNASYSRSDDF